MRARRLAAAGNHPAAVEVWRDVLSEDPLVAEAHAGVANSLLALRRITGAEAEGKAALRIDPENTEAMLVLALTAQFRNQPRKALERIDYLLSVAPWAYEAKCLKATLLRLNDGRRVEAEAAIAEALAMAPDNADILTEAGWQARDRGDYAAVETIARSLLTQDPDRVSALVMLGYARRDRGDKQQALDLALAALAIDPVDGEALELIATVKVSGNPLVGGIWHIMRLLARIGEGKRVFVIGLIYFLYLATLTTFEWNKWPEELEWLFIAVYLAIGLGSWMIAGAIGWMVRRESRAVRLKDY